jgi:predicted kinase
MSKVQLTRPVLLLLYGYPGSGKTFFARQLAEDFSAAHLQADRLRDELFETPQYNRQENDVINNLMEYTTEEFLKAGVSVIWDNNVARTAQRRQLKEVANKTKSQQLLIWQQIDVESAFSRVVKRDKRRQDDKYAREMDRTTFEAIIGGMQNPTRLEDYVVVSGKHTYQTLKNSIVKKLYDLGAASIQEDNVAKPELVNRIPNPLAGRVDNTRRNIIIR